MRPPLLASATSLNFIAEVVNGLSLPTIVASFSVMVCAEARAGTSENSAVIGTRSFFMAAFIPPYAVNRLRRYSAISSVHVSPCGIALARDTKAWICPGNSRYTTSTPARRSQPSIRGKCVLDAGRKLVLGREPVIDCDDERVGVQGESRAQAVMRLEIALHPAATVEVSHGGQQGGRRVRRINTRGKVPPR